MKSQKGRRSAWRWWALVGFAAAMLLMIAARWPVAYISGSGFAFGLGPGGGFLTRSALWWASFPQQSWSAEPTGLYHGARLEDWGTFWAFDINEGGKLLLDRDGERYHQLSLLWPVLLMAAASIWLWRHELKKAARLLKRDRMKCRKCRYDLRGLPATDGPPRCPECGTIAKPAPKPKPARPPRRGRRSIAAWAFASIAAALCITIGVSTSHHPGFALTNTVFVTIKNGRVSTYHLKGISFAPGPNRDTLLSIITLRSDPDHKRLDWWPRINVTSRGTRSLDLVHIPIWPLVILFGGAATWSALRRRRFRPGRCASCGYDLTGTPTSTAGVLCPECGASSANLTPAATTT